MRAAKPKKKRKLSAVKRDALAWLSKCIRLSEAAVTGYGSCVTCGHGDNWVDLQAGHFVARAQGNLAAFDIRNIHTQCFRCNINLGGNGAEYFPWMVAKYGQEVVEEIRQLAGKTVKYTQWDYEQMAEHYSLEFKRIEAAKHEGRHVVLRQWINPE